MQGGDGLSYQQGAFIAIFSVAAFFLTAFFLTAFMDVAELEAEIDRFPGTTGGAAGGLERLRQRDYGRDGLPVADDHRQSLEELTVELGVESPFQRSSTLASRGVKWRVWNA